MEDVKKRRLDKIEKQDHRQRFEKSYSATPTLRR